MRILAVLNALLLAFHVIAQNTTNSTISTNTTSSVSGGPDYPLTKDGSCGTRSGFRCLANGTSPCCSLSGFCGNDAQYCSADRCQEGYGKCSPNTATLGFPACSWAFGGDVGDSPRCDGRCGNGYDGAKCDANASADAFQAYGVYGYGKCCSSAGYCGSTEEHCSPSKQCQSGCNGSSPSTATSAAPAATSSSAGLRTRVPCLSADGTSVLVFSLLGVAFAGLL